MIVTAKVLSGARGALAFIWFALQAVSVNFSGKWVIPPQQPGQGSAGQTLTINQVGNNISGVLQMAGSEGTEAPVNGEIWDGKVNGETISFYVWRGEDSPAKVFFRGSLKGDEIVFTVTGEPPPPVWMPQAKLPLETRITAKRER